MDFELAKVLKRLELSREIFDIAIDELIAAMSRDDCPEDARRGRGALQGYTSPNHPTTPPTPGESTLFHASKLD